MFEIEEVVVQKSYTEEEIYIDVFVALIQKKEAASILEKFCEEIPLQSYGLNHLKRIQSLNRSDKSCPLLIVVCPVKLYDEIPTHIKALCNEKEVRKVCRLEPQCRSEFEDWNVGWPINFHASHLEKEREKGLSVDEIKQVQFAFDVLLREEENSANIGGCGVVINPENGKVVTTTSDAHQFFMRKYNTLKPGIEIADERVVSSSVFQALHTATMQCIEGVAAVVRGDLKNGEAVLPENAYLCSGLDLYLSYEPDLMSSMALVHSRIRRVFFKHRDAAAGALISGRGHIHSLRALNHHYRVFQLHSKGSKSSKRPVADVAVEAK